jgi:glycine dehydrogenase
MTDSIWTGARAPHDEFARRHIGPRDADAAAMLGVVGAGSLDALIADTVPAAIRQHDAIGFGPGMSEAEVLQRLRAVARRNVVATSLIGQGYYGTVLPPVIQRNLLENPAWYTAYTPYQPEISQGRLEALLNFQTMVADLTGLDIANASLLDEATAAAEAMALAQRVSKSAATGFFVDQDCHPQTIDLLRTRAAPLGWTLVIGDPERDLDPASVFGALFQYPGTTGRIRDYRQVVAQLHVAGAIAAFAADPLALTLLTPPGELGADICIGSMQRFGVPMGYGGPHAAYMAVKDAWKRALPGRLVGVSIDASGRPAYRLALQTREQHIRREKATSNICTAQVLLAVIASMYAVWHGPEGLTAIARRIARLTSVLAAGLEALGYTVVASDFFDTISVEVGHGAQAVHGRAHAAGINLRRLSPTRIGISLDELTGPRTVETVWRAFSGDPDRVSQMIANLVAPADRLPDELRRRSAFLTHPVFHTHRSETEMMRYLRQLSDKDLALDRAMIPLGSCTMKLNAAVEMMAITWPEFAALHPFAPEDQAAGYAELFADLEARLCAISGYDAVSLQPNSGAQGEYAGLLAIRGYHLAQAQQHRDICLIPSSAHGTNPASAQMAGMQVVVVGCDTDGNIDIADLAAKIETHRDRLAAMMITYPSTHGVFEEQVRDICAMVHAAGGQVYLDGANLNAQVGLARPGAYGADVSHFNLHKTFCIPHGGGGPGMGPIGVKAHLAPYLPGHVARGGSGAVSAAPYGSASILPISWAYMMLMGDEGLRRATEVAILNANYMAKRLEPHFPVLYRGGNGRVAHECIIDLRPIKDETGISVDDIAKRLIDYGFHAPTVSFPVAGTMMIEPTESESRAELDRFCDAMIAIAAEIAEVRDGRIKVEDSALRHAPHTACDITGEWNRAYSRIAAVFPSGVSAAKYWPPVGRLDNSYGDRNIVCSCPPLAVYAEAAE